tara:strand:- start:4376 stop:4927 length:552 start_codon:yes stop_codon:yes gene_type:complete
MVNKELLKEIEEYCKLNELDTTKTLNKALRSGFTIVKFGETPIRGKSGENVVEVTKEVEKVVEVIKEVPVEKIVEVEVIKEVFVDRIVEVIKEVPVDKEVIKEVQVEKNININVDGHKVDFMEYIEQLNITISKLEIEKTKASKNLLDNDNKIKELEKELLECKTKLQECLKRKKNNLDLYGE